MVDMLRADLEANSSPTMRASSDAKGDEPNARSVAAARPSLCRFPRLAQCCGLLVVIVALLVGLFVGWRLRPKDGIVSDLLCPNVFDGPPLCHELLDLPGFLVPGSMFHEKCQEKCNEKDSNVGKVCRVVKAKPGLIPCTTVLDVKETAKALARQIGDPGPPRSSRLSQTSHWRPRRIMLLKVLLKVFIDLLKDVDLFLKCVLKIY